VRLESWTCRAELIGNILVRHWVYDTAPDAVTATVPALPASLLDRLREAGELKRIRSAAQAGSIAERLFLRAWAHLAAGMAPAAVAQGCLVAAAAATRLGDLDLMALLDLGLERAAALDILRASAAAMPEIAVSPDAFERFAAAPAAPPPPFALLLARQPRAGITCPGKARVMLEPPENHAEHCLMVALYGAVLSGSFGADPERVWLAGLAHHLHNAFLPDSGFTGEMLLGEHLEPVMRRATGRALAELEPSLAGAVRAARAILPDAATPDGRAFHAADTLDRVWQIDQHLRPGRLDLRFVLGDMALVHDGPVKPFQDALLRQAGLWP